MELQNDKKRKAEDSLEGQEEVENLDYVNHLSTSELRSLLDERGQKYDDIVEKEDLIVRVKNVLAEGLPVVRRKQMLRKDCPYLDTIDRKMLDFDFEKLCSVTLQNMNVYACLVCGKYFQGRGKGSQAYIHSVQANHYVFINLNTEKVYCLPDDYEVIDSSLADIKHVLNPKYKIEQIKKLDAVNKTGVIALDGTEYIPGSIGLNNTKNSDYINVVLQVLVHVAPFRNFFMDENNYSKFQEPLLTRLSELIRKVYNPKNFKGQVSPHELLQAISDSSNKKFAVGSVGDPLDFLQFFLNTVHRFLTGGKKGASSIVHQVFQGIVEVTTTDPRENVVTEKNPYLTLTLDIPPPPLFKDESEKNIIPQIPIFTLLSKFDGTKTTHLVTGYKKKIKLLSCSQYLIVHLKRFTKNNWFWEKNPTIVTFPLKNFDLSQYIKLDTTEVTKYDLIGSICHEGEAQKGSYKAHVYSKSTEQWFEMQDLVVKPIMPQLIPLSESYMLFYERQRSV